MSKLKEDELLGELAHAFACSTISEQAYKQIVALIKKPEVTEEWYEEKAKKLRDESYYYRGKNNKYYSIALKKAKDLIRSFVEEIRGI